MAIAKTATINSPNKQQVQQLVNEMMESIKSATTTDRKNTFHNLLNNPSFSALSHGSDSHQPHAYEYQKSRPVGKQSHPTEITGSPSSAHYNQSSDKIVSKPGTEPKDLPLETEPQIQELSSKLPLAEDATQLAALSLIKPGQNSNLLDTATTGLATLNMQDKQIQNWIKEGRVIIEKLPSSELSSQMAAQPNHNIETNLPQELDPHMASLSDTVSNTYTPNKSSALQQQILESEPFLQTDQNTRVQTSEKELSKTNPQPNQQHSQIQGLSPNPIMPVASVPLQNPATITQSIKANHSTTTITAQTINDGNHLHSSAKVQKAATLTGFDKLAALKQIKDQLQQGLKKGETHLNIQLKPYELGKVDIKLNISRDGIVSAFFTAENRETLEVLTRHSQDFQNLFKDSGLQADSQGMNFSLSQHQQEAPEPKFKSQLINNVQDSEPEAVPIAIQKPGQSSSSIDISV